MNFDTDRLCLYRWLLLSMALLMSQSCNEKAQNKRVDAIDRSYHASPSKISWNTAQDRSKYVIEDDKIIRCWAKNSKHDCLVGVYFFDPEKNIGGASFHRRLLSHLPNDISEAVFPKNVMGYDCYIVIGDLISLKESIQTTKGILVSRNHELNGPIPDYEKWLTYNDVQSLTREMNQSVTNDFFDCRQAFYKVQQGSLASLATSLYTYKEFIE